LESEELAKIFNQVKNKLDVNGLFLSSGITKDCNQSTEKMIDAVKLLREKYHFNGYVHFKVLPGTSYDLIKQASELSNRMSLNIEAPNKSTMSELCGTKDYKIDILRRQRWISSIISKNKSYISQTTQIMAGNFSSDLDILKISKWEYENFNLRRVYYSAFRPIQGTELQNEKKCSFERQNRLYNCDFLFRDYGYKFKEIKSIMDDGMLPKIDPKVAIARKFFDSPVDVNESSYDELIRIPGIGPKCAKIISQNKTKYKKISELAKFGVRFRSAQSFIKIDGRYQKTLNEY
ncbi:MAG: radical SAM protein, partial [Nanoarchaeota archaeon]